MEAPAVPGILAGSLPTFPPTTPPFFLFPLSSQCDRCPDVPVWGLKAGLQGLLAMGAFYCLGGWLITVEAPGHPGHPPSTQLDAVVKDSLYMYVDTIHVTFAILWQRSHRQVQCFLL